MGTGLFLAGACFSIRGGYPPVLHVARYQRLMPFTLSHIPLVIKHLSFVTVRYRTRCCLLVYFGTDLYLIGIFWEYLGWYILPKTDIF